MTYRSPPVPYNENNKERRVGLELEFAGIGLERVADIITSIYGGEIRKNHRYYIEIRNTDLGDFRVELDARILQKMAQEDIFDTADIDIEERSFRKSIEDIIDKLAMSVVPVEIVMPPVPLSKFGRLEELRKKLWEEKAEGTKGSLVHAFGMHINIEAPELDVDTILKYLRAFLLLYPWLLEKLEIDISRKLFPFVDPFPKEFVLKVLDVGYAPSQKELISDYIKFNPTRNRPLDLLPILAMLDEVTVKRKLNGEKNTPRPTFHYRLPNSKIDDLSWTFAKEWNYWIAVEELAQKPEMIDKLAQLYVMRKEKTLVSFKKEWVESIVILLDLNEE